MVSVTIPNIFFLRALCAFAPLRELFLKYSSIANFPNNLQDTAGGNVHAKDF